MLFSGRDRAKETQLQLSYSQAYFLATIPYQRCASRLLPHCTTVHVV